MMKQMRKVTVHLEDACENVLQTAEREAGSSAIQIK